MNPSKKTHLDRIRKESAYPAFRSLISLVRTIFYGIGGLICVLDLIWIQTVHAGSPQEEQKFQVAAVAIFVCGLSFFLLGKLFKEISSVIADISDTLTDLHSRYEP